ncbi:MAG TPA: hypothetical protein VJM34_14090 [Novosphingobium sp.]|nr:hypothetical protein [Novosphingobium sp.]
MRQTPLPLLLAAALSACGSDPPDPNGASSDGPATGATAPQVSADPAAVVGDAAESSDDARVSRYTSVKGCRVTESNAEEGGWSVSACPGLGGYRLELTESDLRQNLVIRPPTGGEHGLDPAEATGSGGFSRIGETVEWRGTGEGAAFRPRALIVRYLVVENPDRPSVETGYLLTVRLANGGPCITGRLPPGPEQNEKARDLADGKGRCI